MNIKSFIKTKVLILIMLIPLNLCAKEFLNTIMHINFGVMFGFPFGEMINYEKNDFFVDETYKNKTKRIEPDHYDTSFGVSIDLSPFPPLILGNESHAMKFGIRGTYRFHYVLQKMTIKEDATYDILNQGTPVTNTTNDDIDFSDNLLVSQSWMVGPVIHYAPFIKTIDFDEAYSAVGGFTFFVLFGQIHQGTLTAFASRRESGMAITTSNHRARFSAFRIDAGMGAEIAICSMNIGLNLYYSYIDFELTKEVYPIFGKNSTLHEVCIEIYVGIPIVWTKTPKII